MAGKQGFLKRLFDGMSKTRNNLVGGLNRIFGLGAIDDDFYEELEEILITADIGVRTTDAIITDLQEKVKEQKLKDPEAVRELLINTIKEKMDLGENAYDFENKKSVLLIIGVNGVGKTTSIGKLAGQFIQMGKSVTLAAADTFRAGAIEQLKTWADRSGAGFIAHTEGSDPAAVVFDAVSSAKSKNTDILICDTAGRLHNKKNLMEELKKINRIIGTEYPDAFRETFIVLDGTTGQNALSQAREFMEVADITGIILTKMDGTAKGGIAVAIQSELGIPVKYIGVGEHIEDLQKFDAKTYVDALFTEAEFEEEPEIVVPAAPEPIVETVPEPVTEPAVAETTSAQPETSAIAEQPEETGLVDPKAMFDVFTSEFFRKQSTWDLLTEVFVDEDTFDVNTFDFEKYAL
ncbi:MAG: signal recognition particle-docking protein FtsY [Lachnospiraceae bacterium]|nr:signal recognition particle-docking protein FtsY [Lachnospiraceae bacterium]